METRKLIKFGNSSHVLAVPHKWLKEHNLNKGDSVYISKNGNGELVIAPEVKEVKKELKNITIITNKKEFGQLKREIVASYINGYDNISLVGDGVVKYDKKIKDFIRNLIALEIMEHSRKKITAKNFLDLNNISVRDIVKKMDLITRSMFEDVKGVLKKEIKIKDISERDKEIDRLMFLLFRIKRELIFNPPVIKLKHYSSLLAIRNYDVGKSIEMLADKLKYMLKNYFNNIKDIDRKLIIGLLNETEQFYIDTLKAFYKNDTDLAYKLSTKKNPFIVKLDNLNKKYWNRRFIPIILEQIKEMILLIHNIGRNLYGYILPPNFKW